MNKKLVFLSLTLFLNFSIFAPQVYAENSCGTYLSDDLQVAETDFLFDDNQDQILAEAEAVLAIEMMASAYFGNVFRQFTHYRSWTSRYAKKSPIKELVAFDNLELTTVEDIMSHPDYPEVIEIAKHIFEIEINDLDNSPLKKHLMKQGLLENKHVSFSSIPKEEVLSFIIADIDAIVVNAYLSTKKLPYKFDKDSVVSMLSAAGFSALGGTGLYLTKKYIFEKESANLVTSLVVVSVLETYRFVSHEIKKYKQPEVLWADYLSSGRYKFHIGEAVRKKEY